MKKTIMLMCVLLLCSFSSYALTTIKDVDIQFVGVSQQGREVVFEFSCRNNMPRDLVVKLEGGRSHIEQVENILFLIPDSRFVTSKWSSPNSIKFTEQMKIEKK